MRLIIILSIFLTSLSAWAGTFNVWDRISIVDGILSIDSMDKPEEPTALCIIRNWKDYSFSADMRIAKAESGGGNIDTGGLIVSRVEEQLSYSGYWIMGCTRHGIWGAGSLIKSKFNVNAWVVFLAGVPRIGEWYRLNIDQEGSKISSYISDELKHQANDDLQKSGGVCLVAYNAIVEFDNVVITGDDIPDVGPSGYAVQPKAKLAATWGEIKK